MLGQGKAVATDKAQTVTLTFEEFMFSDLRFNAPSNFVLTFQEFAKASVVFVDSQVSAFLFWQGIYRGLQVRVGSFKVEIIDSILPGSELLLPLTVSNHVFRVGIITTLPKARGADCWTIGMTTHIIDKY